MLKEQSRRTKSIMSLRGKAIDPKLISQFSQHSFDALRLVYDHDGIDKIKNFMIELKNSYSEQLWPIPIMIDIADKVLARVANISQNLELSYGTRLSFSKDGKQDSLKIVCDDFETVFKENATIYAGYGDVIFKGIKVSKNKVEVEVVQGGIVYPGSDIYVPETQPEIKFEDLNKDELLAFVNMGIDYFVVPGFVMIDDVKKLIEHLLQHTKSPPWLILKVNSEKVVTNLDVLLEQVHGVFISRLDLALNFGPAAIPMITKEIIQSCNGKAKLVVTASEMLGSMRRNVTPTRAEVSDIANAVHDGTDAVVVSDEVAFGEHAAKAWNLMDRIIKDAEGYDDYILNWIKSIPAIETEMDAVAFSAYRTAKRLKAKAIVCITKDGNTALKLASFRPPISIIAATFSPDVLRRLSLVRGVDGIMLDADPNIDQVLPLVNDRLVRNSWLKVGDRIVFVSITLSSVGREASNLFTIQTLQ